VVDLLTVSSSVA